MRQEDDRNADAMTSETPAAADADPTCAGRVIVVDDEPAIAEVAAVVLTGAGFCVERADSAERCLELVAANEYDAVLTDIRMGAMDGLELAGRLRLLVPEMRVVIMTSNDDYDTVRAALSAGAYDYLDKPLNRHALLVVTLSHAVRASRSHRRDIAERQALRARVAELEASESRLRALAGAMRKALHLDERTGLASRRGIHEHLGRLLRSRADAPLSLAVLQLEGYGRTFGELGPAGADAALAELVRVMRLCTPRMDLVGHAGDGRFIAVLPDTSARRAAAWADRLCEAAREESAPGSAAVDGPAVRIALACVEGTDASPHPRDLLARATAALQTGTGPVVVAADADARDASPDADADAVRIEPDAFANSAAVESPTDADEIDRDARAA